MTFLLVATIELHMETNGDYFSLPTAIGYYVDITYALAIAKVLDFFLKLC